MDVKMGCKIHNRFDIEVKDIRTGEIVQRGQAENIVLDSMYATLTNTGSSNWWWSIHYGRGTGTLEPTRTSLFSKIGYIRITEVEKIYNTPPLASYRKCKIVITPSTAVGEIITEVGLGTDNTIYTHALIKDAEGNPLSIGPKTDTQEITIYATVFAELTMPDGMALSIRSNENLLLETLLGNEEGFDYWSNTRVYADKSPLIVNAYDRTNQLGSNVNMKWVKAGDRKISSQRIRFETSNGNGKIWSMLIGHCYSAGDSTPRLGRYFQILFPNSMWPGYKFTGKDIGIGDGTKTKFILPWSDINTTKEYNIYIDGALKTEVTDYTLANSETETSVTFTTAPAIDTQITGDWHVDYIPKDSDHVLDITFTIEFGEGA